MKPIPFNETNPSEKLTIHLETGQNFSGLFTSLRVDRKTLPAGMFAYDIRDCDDGREFIQVKTHVLVNHAGTIITDTPIPNADRGVYIDHWRFLN